MIKQMADTVENTPEPSTEEVIQEAVEQVVSPPEPIKKPKGKTTKKSVTAPPPPKPAPIVEEEEEEEEAPPTLVIHKRHKKSKPRKIIVITDDDSEPNTDDEEMPYRKRQEVTVKSKPKEIKPVKLVNEKKAKAFIPPVVEEEEEEEEAPPPPKKTPIRISNPKPAPKPAFKPPKVGDEGRIVGEKPNAALTRAYMSQGQQIEAMKKQSVTGDSWLDNLFGLR